MNNIIFFGHNDVRFFYYRYKDSKYYSLSILLATIIVCIILVFQVILPQIESYFSVRREVVTLRAKISTINQNINFVNNLDKSLLDSQLKVATEALPSDKDFEGIISAISAAAVRSGVSVSDFRFRLDDTPVSTDKKNPNSLSPVGIVLDVRGSSDGGKKFLSEIYEKIPIVEVTDIKGGSSSLIVGVRFFYKPLPKISFSEEEPITEVSESKQELIRKLNSWHSASFNHDVAVPSSSSAIPVF